MGTIILMAFDWLQADSLLAFGGISLLLLVVFIENGLFFGFFLPGDSLLFTAGLLCGTIYLPLSLFSLISTLILSASLGSWLGYWFGRKSGTWIKGLPDGRIYKRKYFQITEDYYRLKGPMAFILGRFLPVIRTFVPILAGIVKMPQKRFMLLNITGVTIWVIVVVFAGNFIGKAFPGIIHHLEWVILVIVLLSLLPIAKTWYNSSFKTS
ncbi:DedA family protein [Marivirga sp. S37H4]|uniref:DedA family protein n=1 Tax=Marivirga aurantiaca TaxID=2802615 RepID=A0A934X1S0_9BACT|nr:DedA family protein [Marivirga aurantiaca]MBK6267094.1 DedA family protein [Marivirga aurantiaca]